MKEIKNYAEVIEAMANLLREIDIDKAPYQTDIYMEIDDENNGRVYTFENVGGNSWLDGDCYRICSRQQDFNSYIDYCNNLDEVAEAIGISTDKLKEEAENYYDCSVDDSDIYDYAKKTYPDEIKQYYIDCVADDVDWKDMAKELFDDFLEESENSFDEE